MGENYEYAVVGEPSRSYLWVISRTPQMDERLYAQIISRLTAQGYDANKLVQTPQQASNNGS